MKKYLVRITETLVKDIEVEAESELDAIDEVQDAYDKAEIVLDDTNYAGVDIGLKKN